MGSAVVAGLEKIDDEIRERAAARLNAKVMPSSTIWGFAAFFLVGCSIGAGFYFWNAAVRLRIEAEESRRKEDADRQEREKVEWRVALQLNTLTAFEGFLQKYPSGRFAEDAAKEINRLKSVSARDEVMARERADWSAAERVNTKEGYRKFLEVWPSGRYASLANQKMRYLELTDIASRESSDWSTAERTGTREAYETFLEAWPNGKYASTANQRLRKLNQAEESALWRDAVNKGTRFSYEAYLEKYPNGSYAAEAKQFLSDLVTAVPLSMEAEARLSRGAEFRECPNCPMMVVVPEGNFMMGSGTEEIQEGSASKDEGPSHGVTIARPFAVGKFEVTFAEWDTCVTEGACRGYRPGDNGWGRGKLPVINVSWDDAKLYVRWLSGKTGKVYRLLSEAEWEYAARAGSTTKFHFGDDAKSLCRYANVADESGSAKRRKDGFGSWLVCNDGYFKTAPVGSFSPNSFQLHDMHGNVNEWVEDVWHDNYEGAPVDGKPWIAGGNPQYRVARGGSYYNLDGGLRSANRSKFAATAQGELLGFRVARTVGP